VTYGPYQHELEAHRQASQRWHDERDAEGDEEYFDPLPGHELVYAPDGQLYGHRERE
jgi:hypothetical protein